MLGGGYMKVRVVYTSHCKDARCLAEDMARYAKTYAMPITDYDFEENVDLLIIGFEEHLCLKDDELEKFVSKLSRDHVKNLALFNLFYFKGKDMEKTIRLCQKYDLPLMRETYSCKKGLKKNRCLDDDIVSGGRNYIEDMINICNHYY